MEQIKKTFDSPSGFEAKNFLLRKLNELKSIENIKEKDTATHQSIDTKAQKRAYFKLKEILEEIMTFTVEIKSKDERDSYAVE